MPTIVHLAEKLSLLAFLTGSMGATGLALAPRELAVPLRDGRFVALTLGLNFLLAPVLAWLLAGLLGLDRSLANGLLLIGGAAGAPFLPKLLEIAHGDLARGVAMMALLTAGTLVFLPIALPRMIAGCDAQPWEIALPMLLWMVVPLLAGMLVKRLRPALAVRLAAPLAKAGSLFLLIFFALLLAEHARALLGLFGSRAVLAAALHAALLFLAGWWLGGPSVKTRGVLGLGTATRNFGAALVPATTSLRDPQVVLMLVASAIAGSALSFSAAAWVKRRTA
jgi:bile acid:Na+ symporter, BASS family